MTSATGAIDTTGNLALPNGPAAPGSSRRRVALVAGIGLLLMAVLAPIAHFGVLENLVVTGDAATTVGNIVADEGLFRLAIAALLVVTFLDIVVAWALYVLMKPVHPTLAMLVGWLRLAAPAVFAVALANLLDVANLLGSAESSGLSPDQLGAQVMASVASFGSGWDMSLAIFGLHLVGLGYLLLKSVDFPRFLGVLVVVAGVGYVADTFARILVSDFEFNISLFTFVGEALLIFWLLWRAIKGFPSEPEPNGRYTTEPRRAEPSTLVP
ncbi:MAG TPA: DUF4386 domain-containing protein [Acidimicrobiia bacterium]|nr:DUF4386 domain-containing protein [Acidimicrobiia bacterium]